MKIENIPADIKSKSLKEAKVEINEILIRLEDKNFDLKDIEEDYKRLIYLNKHIENIFREKYFTENYVFLENIFLEMFFRKKNIFRDCFAFF